MEKTIRGSLGAASAFQMTEDMDALDKQSKKILKYREVLAVILKETVEEYQGYSAEEIMKFIEADSIKEETEVSGGRTNTRIDGAATEFSELSEKTSNFDIAFRAKNPRLSNGEVVVNLYIDVEPQKNYRSGYPIEKRGLYYLARRLCSQLDVITEKTDYGQLEKCYTIFICRDRIPKKEQMSISFYSILNTKNVGNCYPKKEDYDLMTLVIIRLGDKNYHSEEKNVLDFLTIIFHPHQKGFRKELSRYISFEEELGAKEEKHMIGLGLSIYEEGIEEGMELNLLLLVCRKLAKGKTIQEIAELLEEPEDVIQALCVRAEEYAPEYDEKKIRESWRSVDDWEECPLKRTDGSKMAVFRITGEHLKKIKPLAVGWEETMITSCLLEMMGEVYADSKENPSAAQFLLGDFCFFAGEPKVELVKNKPKKSDFIIMCGNSDGWHKLIEQVYGEQAKRVTRYAIKKEGDIFDREKLRQAKVTLPKGYEIKRFDEEIYEMSQKEEWSRDFCSQFLDAADYIKRGLGVAVLYQGELAAGASSYTIYDKGIEIEIDTKPEHRRKGLAYAAGAGLILECLEKGLYPSWDAQNLWSVALAEKLGYHFDHEYTAYEVMWGENRK